MTTIERESRELQDRSEQPPPAADVSAAMNTAAADDRDFEPTIIRGRE